MNSFVYLTVMVGLSFLVGFILSSNTNENQYYDYIYTHISGYTEATDRATQHIESIAHTAGEYKMDDTTGDTKGLSIDIWKILDYGFNPFSFPNPKTFFESMIIWTFTLYKSLMYAYTAFLIFLIYKNKRTN